MKFCNNLDSMPSSNVSFFCLINYQSSLVIILTVVTRKMLKQVNKQPISNNTQVQCARVPVVLVRSISLYTHVTHRIHDKSTISLICKQSPQDI